jgi:hypothetical protein
MSNYFWTLKDSDGNIYLNEFLSCFKDSIDDDMVKAANMDFNTLAEMLIVGFRLVQIEVKEVKR